jgi:hypothetical protein
VDVTSCMEARNAPWPAGDGLDGAEAVACIAGEPLRCGGGRAVQLRFDAQCNCGLACSATAVWRAVHLRFRDSWLPQVSLE